MCSQGSAVTAFAAPVSLHLHIPSSQTAEIKFGACFYEQTSIYCCLNPFSFLCDRTIEKGKQAEVGLQGRGWKRWPEVPWSSITRIPQFIKFRHSASWKTAGFWHHYTGHKTSLPKVWLINIKRLSLISPAADFINRVMSDGDYWDKKKTPTKKTCWGLWWKEEKLNTASDFWDYRSAHLNKKLSIKKGVGCICILVFWGERRKEKGESNTRYLSGACLFFLAISAFSFQQTHPLGPELWVRHMSREKRASVFCRTTDYLFFSTDNPSYLVFNLDVN